MLRSVDVMVKGEKWGGQEVLALKGIGRGGRERTDNGYSDRQLQRH